MSRPTRAVVFGSALALVLSVAVFAASPQQASAQWLPDRAYTEGPGFRFGNYELHPGIALRGGYDTNVFRTPGTTANPEVGSGILAITPHLNLTSLSAQRRAQGEDAAGAGAATASLPPPVAFNLGLSATYFHYFEKDAPKNIEVDLDTGLNVLPERTFGFEVAAQYARNTRAFTANVGGGNNDYAFDRITPRVTLRGQSRGGVLKGTLGFTPNIVYYESKIFRYLSQNQYNIPATLSWKFLPNTALLYDGVLGINDYTKDTSSRASIFYSDGKLFQSRLGINGALTPRLALRLLVGYAAVVLDKGELHDHEDGVGEAALTYAWSLKDSVEVGYQRLVEVSNLGGWDQLDRGYARTTMLFAGAFSLMIEAGVAGVNYGRLLSPDGSPLGVGGVDTREDIRIDGGIHGEYRVTNWLAFMADFSALVTLTDFEYALGTNVPIYPAEFKTFMFFGGVRFYY